MVEDLGTHAGGAFYHFSSLPGRGVVCPTQVVCPAHKFWNNYSGLALLLWSCFVVLLLGIDPNFACSRALRKLTHTSSGTRQHAAFVREEKEMSPPGNLTVDNHTHELGNHLLSHILTLLIVSFVSFSQVNTKNWSALEHISSYGQCNRSQAGSPFACSSLTSYVRRKLRTTCSSRWGLQCSTRW